MKAHIMLGSITWVLSVLGSEVPRHILELGTLGPRSRSTHQGAHNSWFKYVRTPSRRIRSTHTHTRCGYSQSYDQKYPHIYYGWVLLVLGAGVPTKAHIMLGSIAWVLSVLGSEVLRHILGVGTLSPRISSTHTYTRDGNPQSWDREYPHIY